MKRLEDERPGESVWMCFVVDEKAACEHGMNTECECGAKET